MKSLIFQPRPCMKRVGLRLPVWYVRLLSLSVSICWSLIGAYKILDPISLRCSCCEYMDGSWSCRRSFDSWDRACNCPGGFWRRSQHSRNFWKNRGGSAQIRLVNDTDGEKNKLTCSSAERVLRLLITQGWFREPRQGYFANNRLSNLIKKDQAGYHLATYMLVYVFSESTYRISDS